MPEVVYELSLKDHFTGKMHEASSAAESFESTMAGLFETMGVGLGVYKLGEYFNQAREEYEKIEQATHQLQAGLQSTGYAAGLQMEDLSKQAEIFSHSFKFSKGEVEEMQQVLLTFPAVTKATFGDASQSILDMSSKLHRSTEDIAIMVGKALQDPETGIMAMRRVGVNFSHEQSKQVEQMVKDGHKLQAQAYILHELQTEFAGSAAANAAADPLFEYNKEMEETREQVGEMIFQIQKEFAPTLLALAEHFKNLMEWISKNGHEIWSVIKALGAAYIAFKVGSTVVTGYSALMEGLAGAEATAATATEGMAAASTAALGPIGLIAVSIGGLAYVYSELANNAKIAQDEISKMTYANGSGERETIASLVTAKKMQFGLDDKTTTGMVVFHETTRLQKEIAEKQKEVDSLKKQFNDAGMFDNTAVIGSKLGKSSVDLETLKAQLAVAENYMSGPEKVGSVNPSGVVAPGKKSDTANAKGNKSETINIHIDNLQKGDIKIMTTNIKEGAGKIQEMITQALMNAVNNSQLIADN